METLATQTPASAPRSDRDRVPVLGYRNYWYPAVESRALKRRPLGLRMLGDDIVLFRAQDGAPAALAARCPHRGISLTLGRRYHPDTLTCPYHGWTFDRSGALVAVLSEGPDCPMVGKVRTRCYPARELRGFVWLWMGEGAPVDLLDDLPPEFSNPATAIFTAIEEWKANWRIVTENTDGYHAPILHVRSLPRTLYMDWVAWRRTGYIRTEDGKGLVFLALDSEDKADYPGLGHWPRPTGWERFGKRLFGAKIGRGAPLSLPGRENARITEDIHLPGWRRVRVRKHTVFVEWAVPIDEHTTRHFLWDVIVPTDPASWLRRAATRARIFAFRFFIYPLYWRWAYNKRYVGQDRAILETWTEGTENLQANDTGIVAWRQLAREARGAAVTPD